MNVRRILFLGLMMVMLSVAMFVFPGTASAHATSVSHATKASVATASCTSGTCDGQSPVSTGCENDSVIEREDTSKDLGGGLTATLHLDFSPTCNAAWAKVVFNMALLDGTKGDAAIIRKDNNGNTRYYDCNSSGGNGRVEPGQTFCFTPMFGYISSGSLSAQAGYFLEGEGKDENNFNDWQRAAQTSLF